MSIKSLIRTIPDYPKPGIQFRDITTLIQDADGLSKMLGELQDRYQHQSIDKIAAIEARGFIMGTPLACALRRGFIPLRKPGKLPAATIGHDYDLEYGSDRLEMHVDAINPGERVLLVDDLLATGGTAHAATQLIQQAGGQIVECCFIIELNGLGGRQRLETDGHQVFSLCAFDD